MEIIMKFNYILGYSIRPYTRQPEPLLLILEQNKQLYKMETRKIIWKHTLLLGNRKVVWERVLAVVLITVVMLLTLVGLVIE